MSSPFKWPKRAHSHSSTSSTDSDSVLDFTDGQVDLLDDEICSSSDEATPKPPQPLSQHSSLPLAALYSTAADFDTKEDNTRAGVQKTEYTAADERAIEDIVDILYRRKWNIARFLCAYMKSGERPKGRVGVVQDAFKDPEVCELASLPRDDVVPDGANLLPTLRKEFKLLTGKPGFDAYDPTASVDTLVRASTSLKSIQESAPIWYHILSDLLTPERGKEPGRKLQKLRPLQRKLYSITAIVCNTRRPRTASYFHQSLGVHLLSSRVKKHVVEVLNGMGFCASYQVSNEAYSQVAEAQKGCKIDQPSPIDNFS